MVKLNEKALKGRLARVLSEMRGCRSITKRLVPKIKAKRVRHALIDDKVGYVCSYCVDPRALLFTIHSLYDLCGGCNRWFFKPKRSGKTFA